MLHLLIGFFVGFTVITLLNRSFGVNSKEMKKNINHFKKLNESLSKLEGYTKEYQEKVNENINFEYDSLFESKPKSKYDC